MHLLVGVLNGSFGDILDAKIAVGGLVRRFNRLSVSMNVLGSRFNRPLCGNFTSGMTTHSSADDKQPKRRVD